MIEPYPTTCLIYGDAGSHKSEFASTWPKPMLVLCFDPKVKARAYFRRGLPQELMRKGEITTQQVLSRKTNKPIIDIEYYNDRMANRPTAFRCFRERMIRLDRDQERYNTIVVDSVTNLQLAAFNHQRYVEKKGSRDPRRWYAGVAEAINELLRVQAANFDLNVVIIAHVKETYVDAEGEEKGDEVHGRLMNSIAAQGQNSKLLPGSYGETYRAYVDRKGEPWLQTALSKDFTACTQIPAPNPCSPTYRAMWEGE